MNVSAEWVLYVLRNHPEARAMVAEHVVHFRADLEPEPGDVVLCINAFESPLKPRQLYTVLTRDRAYVTVEGLPGKHDIARFCRAIDGVDKLSDMLRAVDSGSWARVLEARKAFL